MENRIRDTESERRFGDILRAYARRHQAPPRLRRDIAYLVRQEVDASPAPAAALLSWLAQKAAPLAAGFVAASVLGVGALQYQARLDDDESLAQQLVATQARSRMPEPPRGARADASSLRAWLANRLTFSPAVAELDVNGYHLDSGRLEHVAGRAVAALEYSRGGHMVSVLACPLRGAPRARTFRRDGVNVVGWTDAQLQYWAISDLDSEDLARFSASFRQAVSR
jgi:anti-sigma factor RsiW